MEQALATAEQRAAGSGAQVKAITKALQGQQKIILFNKSLATDAALRDVAEAASAEGVGNFSGCRCGREEINPLYAGANRSS